MGCESVFVDGEVPWVEAKSCRSQQQPARRIGYPLHKSRCCHGVAISVWARAGAASSFEDLIRVGLISVCGSNPGATSVRARNAGSTVTGVTDVAYRPHPSRSVLHFGPAGQPSRADAGSERMQNPTGCGTGVDRPRSTRRRRPASDRSARGKEERHPAHRVRRLQSAPRRRHCLPPGSARRCAPPSMT